MLSWLLAPQTQPSTASAAGHTEEEEAGPALGTPQLADAWGGREIWGKESTSSPGGESRARFRPEQTLSRGCPLRATTKPAQGGSLAQGSSLSSHGQLGGTKASPAHPKGLIPCTHFMERAKPAPSAGKGELGRG